MHALFRPCKRDAIQFVTLLATFFVIIRKINSRMVGSIFEEKNEIDFVYFTLYQ